MFVIRAISCSSYFIFQVAISQTIPFALVQLILSLNISNNNFLFVLSRQPVSFAYVKRFEQNKLLSSLITIKVHYAQLTLFINVIIGTTVFPLIAWNFLKNKHSTVLNLIYWLCAIDTK